MKDLTREGALLLQQGIREAKHWSWGPLFAYRMDFPHSGMFSIGFSIGPWSVSLALSRAHQ